MKMLVELCPLVLIAVFALVACGIPLRGQDAPDANAKAGTAILFLSPEPQLDAQYAQQLTADGVTFTAASFYEALEPTFFARFNVFVIDKLPIAGEEQNVFGQHMIPFRANMQQVWRCVRDGAGALVYTNLADNGGGLCQGWNDEMAPWGIRLLQACIIDRSLSFAPWTSYGENYHTWTEQLAKHRVTDGLRRIYYPSANTRWDDCYTATPLICDAAWTPLVRAMPGARVATTVDREWQYEADAPTNPVLAAVRQVGNGRLAVLGINPAYTHRLGYTKIERGWYGEMCYGPIDGIILRTGDGKVPSDTGKFVSHLYNWLAGDSAAKGYGGYKTGDLIAKAPPAPSDDEKAFSPILDFTNLRMPPSWRHRPSHVQIGDTSYYPEVSDPFITGELHYFKALVGAHTALSDGRGTVADFAAAAKTAGYALLVFTENFAQLSRDDWASLVDQCARVSTEDFVCLPGLDIQDPDNNHFIIVAPPYYPRAAWLSADGTRLVKTQMINLLYGDHMVVAHRPTTSPLPQERLKHFQGLTVYTYRHGRIDDDSLDAYAWQVQNGSNPHPIVVHELFAPAEVATAVRTGFQQLMPADTVANAFAYFRAGIGHYFDAPARYLISEGPIIDTWSINPKDAGPAAENRLHFRVDIGVHSDAALKSVTLYDGYNVVRRWLPAGKEFRTHVDFQHARQYDLYLIAEDANGKHVVTSSMRTVAERYHYRCADRQNWLGTVGSFYTGLNLANGVDIRLPIIGTEEGNGLFTQTPGTSMAMKLNFPFTSNDVVVTEYLLDEKYVDALREDVGADAMPSKASKPSTVYAGRVRRWSFTPGKAEQPYPTLFDIELTLKRDVEPVNAAGLFPAFLSLPDAHYVWFERNGKVKQGNLGKDDVIDLPVGGMAGGIVALSSGLRVDHGVLGLAPPADTPAVIPAGTRLYARFLLPGTNGLDSAIPATFTADAEKWLAVMGFAGKTPYTLKLIRGSQVSLGYLTTLTTEQYGVAGDVTQPADIPYQLPLCIRGINPRWPTGTWREGDTLLYAGSFEGEAWTRLDVGKAGKFYTGNLLLADNANLVLEVVTWSKDKLTIEVHNPTGNAIEATVSTPKELTNYKQCRRKVTVPAGTTVYVEE